MEAAMRSEEEMMNLILQVAKDDEPVSYTHLTLPTTIRVYI